MKKTQKPRFINKKPVVKILIQNPPEHDEHELHNIEKNRNSFDLMSRLCNNVVGENHTFVHRISFGIILIGSGVVIAKFNFGGVTHYFFDALGYVIHGIGSIPLVEGFVKLAKKASD